jgi:hypothetical protein
MVRDPSYRSVAITGVVSAIAARVSTVAAAVANDRRRIRTSATTDAPWQCSTAKCQDLRQ